MPITPPTAETNPGAARPKPRGDWQQIHNGNICHPVDLQPEEIRIEDIAHSLSLICRFNGHCRTHYSVGQHSLHVAGRAPLHLARQALIHDALEAYTGDLVRPFKRSLQIQEAGRLPEPFPAFEERQNRVIYAALGLRYPTPEDWETITHIDNRVLMTEARDLLDRAPRPWGISETPYEFTVVPMHPEIVRHVFLDQFHLLDERARDQAYNRPVLRMLEGPPKNELEAMLRDRP